MNDIMSEVVKAAEDISIENKREREMENSLLEIISDLEFVLRYCRSAKRETGKNPADSNLLALIGNLADTIELT